MRTILSTGALVGILKRTAEKIPDPRNTNAPNFKHPIERAVGTAYSAFYLQQPSLNAHEEDLRTRRFPRNLRRLFFYKPIKCMQTVRNILDPIDPKSFIPAFDAVFARLDR